jgi:ribonuclease T2
MTVRKVLFSSLALIAAAGLVATPAFAKRKHHHGYSDYGNQGDSGYDDPAQGSQYEKRAPGEDGGSYNTGERNVPGKFDYYALVLSWSPSFCADGEHDDNPQCDRSNTRPYNFVLHGLWPQYDRGWPQDCRTARAPFVPRPLINEMLDIMPAPQLVIHEYKKHGTCSGLDPDRYYALARRAFMSVRIPDRYKEPETTQFVSPEDVTAEFIKANPSLKPEMIAVGCGGRDNRLKEVHICLSKDGEPAACGRNENQRKMCSADSMSVPPVRMGSANSSASPDQPYAPPAAARRRTIGGAIMEYFGKH